MTEPITPSAFTRLASDHVIDRSEAQQLMAATRRDAGQLQTLIQQADPTLDAVSMALAIQNLADDRNPNGCNFVFVGRKGRPDLSHDIVAMVSSADATSRPLIKESSLASHAKFTSWDAFPTHLADLKQRLDRARKSDPEAHVTLNLRLHGNNGTGFKLVDEKEAAVDGHPTLSIGTSVASAAWINAQIAAAGFAPEDLTIVSEACNGARSYVVSRDGFNAAELADVRTQAERLTAKEKQVFLEAHPDGTATTTTPRIFDVPAGTPVSEPYTWIGFQQTVNRGGVALPAFVSGSVSWERRKVSGDSSVLSGAVTPMVAFNRLATAPAVTGEFVAGYGLDEFGDKQRLPAVAAANEVLATSRYRSGR